MLNIIFIENSCEYVAMIIERGMLFQTYFKTIYYVLYIYIYKYVFMARPKSVYTRVNKTHKHVIYMLQGPMNNLK